MEEALAVARWVLVAAAVTATAFTLLYQFSPWWRSWLGRATMIQSIAVMVLLDLSVVSNFFTDWFGPEDYLTLIYVQTVLLVGIFLSNGILTVVLYTLQHKRRRKGKHSNDPQHSFDAADDAL